MAKKRGGRKGRRNKGYWWRAKPRGWYVTDHRQPRKLVDADGQHLRDRDTPADVLRNAYALYLATKQQEVHERGLLADSGITMGELCHEFLQQVKREMERSDEKRGVERVGKRSTWEVYDRQLHNLCYGVPYACRHFEDLDDPGAATRAKLATVRIHRGYRSKPIEQFTSRDALDWLNANVQWGNKRSALGTIRRLFRWAVEMQYLTEYPLVGLKHREATNGARITTISPEQEEALVRYSPEWYKPILHTLIRTGCRPGCEFARLRKRHVKNGGRGMKWFFPEGTKVPNQDRTLWISCEKVIDYTNSNLPNGEGL